MEKVSQGAHFFEVHAWYLKSQQGTHKNFAPEFLILLALKLPSCELVIFMDINTYILTESSGNFKTFFKENYAIALCSCYMLKKMLNIELNMMLTMLMKFAYIRHS